MNYIFRGSVEEDNLLTRESFSSHVQGSFDMMSCQGWVCFKDFAYRCACFKHFQDLPDHDSGTSKCRLAMTYFRVCNNVFVSVHKMDCGEELFIVVSEGEKALMTEISAASFEVLQ